MHCVLPENGHKTLLPKAELRTRAPLRQSSSAGDEHQDEEPQAHVTGSSSHVERFNDAAVDKEAVVAANATSDTQILVISH